MKKRGKYKPRKQSSAQIERDRRIAELFLSGKSQAEIGVLLGVQKGAIQQHCARMGLSGKGGAALQAQMRADEIVACRDRRYVELFELSFAEYMALSPEQRPTRDGSPCQLWEGRFQSMGYGYRDGNVLAHRQAYCDHHEIPMSQIDGLVIRHKCDTPACVNPLHLESGSQADNMHDKVLRGRAKKDPMHGESNPSAKLTAIEVQLIRKLLADRSSTVPQLADEFGVHIGTVSRIASGQSWRFPDNSSRWEAT